MNDPLSLFIHILVPLLFHDIYILKIFPLVRLIFEFGRLALITAPRVRRTHAHGQRPSPLHGASAGRTKWRLSAIGHNYDDQRMFDRKPNRM